MINLSFGEHAWLDFLMNFTNMISVYFIRTWLTQLIWHGMEIPWYTFFKVTIVKRKMLKTVNDLEINLKFRIVLNMQSKIVNY